jgi:uncharacterized protein YjeT (DUF2065 family)
MQSIVYQGIFTSHAFFAVIFMALGLFLFYKARNKINIYAKSDKKLYISGIISLGAGVVFFIMYVIYLKTIL